MTKRRIICIELYRGTLIIDRGDWQTFYHSWDHPRWVKSIVRRIAENVDDFELFLSADGWKALPR